MTSQWRERYKVHPAANVFPMMSDEELAVLGADIKANGISRYPLFDLVGDELILIDGRNRLEAAERAGLAIDDVVVEDNVIIGDPVARIISENIHRRHLTKQECADYIVAAIKAGKKLDQNEPVSKGGRGKVNGVKAEAVAEAKKHGISEATVKRAFAKANADDAELEARARANLEKKAKAKAERKAKQERMQAYWRAAHAASMRNASADAASIKRRREMMSEIIEAGYRMLAAKYHPDKGGSSEDFIALGEAREHLKTRNVR